jgi:hypothetical protein
MDDHIHHRIVVSMRVSIDMACSVDDGMYSGMCRDIEKERSSLTCIFLSAQMSLPYTRLHTAKLYPSSIPRGKSQPWDFPFLFSGLVRIGNLQNAFPDLIQLTHTSRHRAYDSESAIRGKRSNEHLRKLEQRMSEKANDDMA